MRVCRSYLLGLAAALVASSALAGEGVTVQPVPAEVVEQGVRALQADIVAFIRASASPWDIDDPTRDSLFIEPAANNPRVLGITRKLGLPHERIFVNLVMPYGSQSDGYNAMISDELAQEGTDIRLAFIIAHEYAHGLLNHRMTASIDAYREQLAYCPDCTDPSDVVATVKAGFANPNLTAFRERVKRLELDADEWAAQRVARRYAVPDGESLLAPQAKDGADTKDEEGETHYSYRRRLKAVEAQLRLAGRNQPALD